MWIVEQDGSERQITFAQMMQAAPIRWRRGLRELGITKGERVILDARQSGRTVGGDARGSQARRRDHADDSRARPCRRRRPHRTGGGARFVIANASDAAKFDAIAGGFTGISVGGRVDG